MKIVESTSSPAGSPAVGSFLFGPWVLMSIFILELSLLPAPLWTRNEGSDVKLWVLALGILCLGSAVVGELCEFDLIF